MKHLIPTAKRVVVGVVAVGALTVGSAGLAGAATTATPKTIAQFNCARATTVLTRIQTGESHIAAGLPKLTAPRPRPPRMATWRGPPVSRSGSPGWRAPTSRADWTAAAAAIEAKCQVTAPTGSSTPTS